MIARAIQVRLRNENRAVVRAIEAVDQAADADRHAASDDGKLTSAVPVSRRRLYHLLGDAAPEYGLAEGQARERTRRIAAPERRSEQQDAPWRKVRGAPKQVHDDHAAEAMPDQMQALAVDRGEVFSERGRAGGNRIADRAIRKRTLLGVQRPRHAAAQQ